MTQIKNNSVQIAVVGSGIAGLSAAWHLAQDARVRVTLFESDTRLGGHANTVDVAVGGKTFGVDTGFLVFNHKTYPGLTPFFELLGVVTAPSDMGFSVQVGDSLEWAGNSLSSVFTQRKNLFNPRFWRMLRDMLRFNKAATQYALLPPSNTQTLGEYLLANRYSTHLRDWYLVPMAAAIWSCPTQTMLAYPMATFSSFCHNHGLLQVTNRPQWYTVQGGSRNYVSIAAKAFLDKGSQVYSGQAVTRIERHSAGLFNEKVTIHTTQQSHSFDAVVVATHSDQALKLLDTSTVQEQCVLGAIKYQPNVAVLHTDSSVLPSHPRAWAAWNYETQADTTKPNGQRVCLHYLLNKLQPLPVGMDTPVIVSLNPIRSIEASKVIQTFYYDHPVFDSGAIAAQQALPSIQGDATGHGVWFAGAWANYGFHEDGYQSGLAAARGVLKMLDSR
jgi:predicted NAD/FAD-binding protein